MKDIRPTTTNPINCYLFKKGNYIEINKALKLINWQDHFEDKDVDECFSLLNTKYMSLIQEHTPVRKLDPNKIDSRDRIKWFNLKIKNATKDKYRLHSQMAASASQLPELKRKFNLACREVE